MMKLPHTTKAVIFDLDGTLLDTEPLYTDATQLVLDPYGKTYTMELKRRVMGGDSRVSARTTIDELELPLTVEEYLQQRETHLNLLFPNASEIPGAGEFVSSMGRSECKVGLATSSNQVACDLKIGHREWTSHFDTVVCGDDSELTASKPEPDIFLLCAKRLGVNPANAVAFEDSRNGILAAKAAGMTVFAVESPYSTPEDLADADETIPDFNVFTGG